MNINTAIQNATLTHLLPEIARNATTRLSILGKRTIQVPGYEGSAPIDVLAAKVIQLVRAHGFEYTLHQRASGEFIAQQIDRIYSDSDRQVDNSNCITRLVCYAKEFFYYLFIHIRRPNTSYDARWCWKENSHYSPSVEQGYRVVFQYYTQRQFLERYGREPETEMRFGVPGDGFLNVRLAIGHDQGQDAEVDWESLHRIANAGRV